MEQSSSQPIAAFGDSIAGKALEVLPKLAGKTYKWGGRSDEGVDCSGFVARVLGELWPEKKTIFDNMAAISYTQSPYFTKVNPPETKRAGDLVFFPAAGTLPNHIGIVLSDMEWISSQSSTGVAKVPFTNQWWNARSKQFYRMTSAPTASHWLRSAQKSWSYA